MSKLSEKCALNASTHTLPAKCNGSDSGTNFGKSSSSSLGVHRFCSKLRHKIEDNLTTSRLTNKFAKGSRHSISMSSLSGLTDATIGKYTTKTTAAKDNEDKLVSNKDIVKSKKIGGMLKYRRFVAKSTQHLVKDSEPIVAEVRAEDSSAPPTSFVGTYVDSDDEYQLPSLSLTKQSLEDEIFEELEKVAHDEKKLNTVLKTFDRILTDFHDEIEVQHLLAASKNILLQAEQNDKNNDKKDTLKIDEKFIEPNVNVKAIENAEKVASINVKLQAMKSEKMAEKIIQNKWQSSSLLLLSTKNEQKVNKKNYCLPKIEKSHTTLCEANLMSNMINNNSNSHKLSTKLNKSVLDITTNTGTPIITSKIPVWKALPLSKRSKSFCYATIEETLHKLNSTSNTSANINYINNTNNNNNNNVMSKSMLHNRAVSYSTLPITQQQQAHLRNRSAKSKPNLIKSKTELNVKTSTKQQKLTTLTTTISAKQAHQTRVGVKSSSGLANLRRSHTNSDELLDKCLEKGQQILRKIESLGTQGGTATATTTTTKATAAVAKTTKRNITPASTMSAGATTTINGTLKGKKKCNAMPKKLTTEKVNNNIKIMADKKPVTISPVCELKYLAEKGRQNSDALSDDSGHISNEANDNHQQTLSCESTTSSTLDSVYLEHFDTTSTATAVTALGAGINKKSASKVFKLMQKFETTTNQTLTAQPLNVNKILNNYITSTATNQIQQHHHKLRKSGDDKKDNDEEEVVEVNEKISSGICTSIKVAKVEPIHCIKTHIEIFPNYSKEVTTWFY